MGRPAKSLNKAHQLFQKRIRDIISDEEYTQVIQSLVDIALNSRAPNARVAAIKLIIERIEGAVPIKVEDAKTQQSINDILGRANDDD